MSYTGFENHLDDELCAEGRVTQWENKLMQEMVRRLRQHASSYKQEVDELQDQVAYLQKKLDDVTEELEESVEEVAVLAGELKELRGKPSTQENF
jgi:peptidoglycan hydrolase CwlO-like protein